MNYAVHILKNRTCSKLVKMSYKSTGYHAKEKVSYTTVRIKMVIIYLDKIIKLSSSTTAFRSSSPTLTNSSIKTDSQTHVGVIFTVN